MALGVPMPLQIISLMRAVPTAQLVLSICSERPASVLQTTGTANNWRPLKNTYGAVWEGSQLSNLPLDLQVTKANGTSVVLR